MMTRQQLAAIFARLDELERRVAELEQQRPQPEPEDPDAFGFGGDWRAHAGQQGLTVMPTSHPYGADLYAIPE